MEDIHRYAAAGGLGLTPDGKYLKACDAALASLEGKVVWMHTNGLPVDFPHKKAHNADIVQVRNIPLDAEYPPNPDIAHVVGRLFKELCVKVELMHPEQPIENSGAGPHIIIPT